MSAIYRKDPDEILDYGFDWSNLAPDIIVASEWIVEEGLTAESDSFDADSATVWLSGGAAGCNYLARNRVETAGGRTYERALLVEVRDSAPGVGVPASQAEQDLAAIDAAIRALSAGGAVQEYAIGNRSLKRYSLAELIALRSHYAVLVQRERQAARTASGGPFFKRLETRFICPN
jgi:hypothetical protein